MRRQKIKLTIDNPCKQKWADFEDRGGRGYCASCQKEVIDFTRMSDGEIRNYFWDLPKGVCGQFRQDQMKVYADPSPNVFLSKWLSWSVAASALLFTGGAVNAQGKDRKEQVQTSTRSDNPANLDFGKRTVSGRVTDENGEGLPGVNVVINGTTKGTMTNLDGYYHIELNSLQRTLVFSTVGMHSVEISLADKIQVDVKMRVSTVTLGGVIAVCSHNWYTPRGLFHRVKGFFGRLF